MVKTLLQHIAKMSQTFITQFLFLRIYVSMSLCMTDAQKMTDSKRPLRLRAPGNSSQLALTKEELVSLFQDSPRNRSKSKMKPAVLGEVEHLLMCCQS